MRLLCGDETIEIDVRDGKEAAHVTVAGTAFDVRVEPVGPGTFLFVRGDHRETFHCVRDGDAVHLFWRGRVYRLEEETERRRASHRQSAGGLEAPMPGKVIAVKVAPGDTVVKGDELLVVEAMKMENAVRAPRDGRVKSVSARTGDMVSPGVVLVELE
ncbi:MAG TPA: biotin/lipoyl-containing protein [Vicinamibacteria bacterium]|nr:biotin/lipoyl-containing protein [Vicinamibacteria bacterium]